jgi:hypothetical protein
MKVWIRSLTEGGTESLRIGETSFFDQGVRMDAIQSRASHPFTSAHQVLIASSKALVVSQMTRRIVDVNERSP